MLIETIIVGPLQVNCYILACPQTGRAVVIDPGADPEKITRRIKKKNFKVEYIINTHGHIDHIGANAVLGVPVYIHRLDADFLLKPELNLSGMLGAPLNFPAASLLLEDKQKLRLGNIELEVIHTPGHTPGGICLKTSGICFTGDTLFAQSIGRTDLPYASYETILNSIRGRLMSLDDNVVIYPGHGSSSTIGEERENNPFI
ncbi:MAG: MBL fold metallo-hydrolase [Candidatus Omnitrophota bacterium]